MYDPTPNSNGDGFGAIAYTEFLHNVLNMPLHGLFRDKKKRGNVAVSISSGDLLKDLNLSLAQRLVSKMLHELNCDLGRNVFHPGMHLANHIYELFSGHVLEHVALRSRLKRAVNLGISFERCKPDHAGICKLCANGEQGVDATHIRHPDIHKCHVGSMITKFLNGFWSC